MRAEAHFERARGYFRTGKFEEALAAIDDAVNADATYVRARVARAYTLRRLGLLPEALRTINDVLQIDGGDALALAAKGAILQALGKPEDGRAVFETALAAARPESSALVNYNYACFWALSGDAQKAKEYLGEALRLDPAKKSVAAVDRDFEQYRADKWFQDVIALG